MFQKEDGGSRWRGEKQARITLSISSLFELVGVELAFCLCGSGKEVVLVGRHFGLFLRGER